MSVGIIGAGSWGTTIAHLAAQHDRDALLWARREDLVSEINESHSNERYLPGRKLSPNLRASSSLQEIAERCEVIVIAVPCKHFRQTCGELGAHLRGDHIVIHGSKGLEPGTLARMSEIIRQETCVKKVGVLSGPNLALEILDGRPSGSVIASHYVEVCRRGADLLGGATFRVYTNTDVVGVELGGTLKNVFAIASGILHERQMGDNARSLLVTRGLAEMSRIGALFGADPITFSGLAGIGDMMATCFSPLSRNYQVGTRLAQGQTLEEITASMFMVAEGVNTTAVVHELGQRHHVKLPICESLYRILFQHERAETLFDALMSLRAEYEVDGIRR